jgi:hypothetical protein
MAKPITSRSSQFLIKLGDGGSPEVFTAPCGLNSKGINFTKDFNDIAVPDCDNPEAPAWTERAVTQMAAEISGDGILSMGDLEDWIAFNESTVSKNVEIVLDVDAPNATLGGKWTGKFLMGTFNVTADLGSKVQVAVSMSSDGQVTWVPNP